LIFPKRNLSVLLTHTKKKLLGENIGQMLQDLGFCSDFLDVTLKGTNNKRKNR
jgi:hypothetical protein